MSKKRLAMLIATNILIVLALLALFWPAESQTPVSPPPVVLGSPPPSHTPEAPKAGSAPVTALASNHDPICDMEIDAATTAATTVHEGKTYGFCSVYCKAEFEKDPAKYIAKLAEATKEKK